MVAIDPNTLETYDYGVTRFTTLDDHIMIVRTHGDMSRGGVNTWASLLILTMQEWHADYPDRPLAILHDLTHPNQGLTPYTRERTLDILCHRPQDMVVYNALVLPDTFIKRIIGMFVRMPIFQHQNLKFRIFSTEEKATRWLRESINSH